MSGHCPSRTCPVLAAPEATAFSLHAEACGGYGRGCHERRCVAARGTELGVLERALEAVGAGRSWVVGVVGEPGIGKSRLLGELSDRSAERGHLVLAGRAELERDVPFAFVLLRRWVDGELGRLDPAEADAEEALESALLSGNLQVAYWSSIVLSRTALARGRIDAAVAHGQAAWEKIGTIEYSQAGYAVADARLAAATRGRGRRAGGLRVGAPALWTLDRLKAVDIAVRVLLTLGRVDEADAWAQRAPAEGGGRRTGASGAIIAHAQAHVLLARDLAPQAADVAREGRPRPTRAPPRCGAGAAARLPGRRSPRAAASRTRAVAAPGRGPVRGAWRMGLSGRSTCPAGPRINTKRSTPRRSAPRTRTVSSYVRQVSGA
ncbi:MAG: ATP-binding protein, partial [Solirubrobacteraceae bacterium]